MSVVSKAKAAVGKGAAYTGMCEKFTRTCFGFSAKYYSAKLAYQDSARDGKIHKSYNAPAGVPVFWDITYGKNAPYDHVAVSVGGGYCVSTSAGPGRTVAKVKIADLTRRWGMNYRGWAEVYHGVRVYHPKSTPKDDNHGFSSDRTKSIQRALREVDLYDGRIDGDYGPMTVEAVKDFQRKHDLYVDGIWGPKTSAYWKTHFRSSEKTNNAVRSAANARNLVRGMGYSSVSSYQKSQRCPQGLRPDGVWGKITEAHYDETRAMQSAMNKWKGDNLRVDGDYGRLTQDRVRDLKHRNKGGTWHGSVNSSPNTTFLNMIGVSNAHNHR